MASDGPEIRKMNTHTLERRNKPRTGLVLMVRGLWLGLGRVKVIEQRKQGSLHIFIWTSIYCDSPRCHANSKVLD